MSRYVSAVTAPPGRQDYQLKILAECLETLIRSLITVQIARIACSKTRILSVSWGFQITWPPEDVGIASKP